MQIERTKDEVIIRLPSHIDTEGLQRFVDYLSYKEASYITDSKEKNSKIFIIQKD